MRPARVSSIVCALALLLTGAIGVTAEPAPATATAQLEVQALPECTSREELIARITARSRRIHFDDDASGGPTLRVTVAATPRHRAVGDLVIVGTDGRSSARRLSAPTCAEATDALALDHRAHARPVGGDRARSASAAGGRRTAAPAPFSRRPWSWSPPPPPRPATRRFGVGQPGQVLFGLSPDAMPGIALWAVAGLDRGEPPGLPALLLAWVHAFDSSLSEMGGTAGFSLDAASLDACPLRLRATVVEARAACGTALVGRLVASGSETYSPTSTARPPAARAGSSSAAVGGALLVTAGPWHLLEVSWAALAPARHWSGTPSEFLPYIFFHRTDLCDAVRQSGRWNTLSVIETG